MPDQITTVTTEEEDDDMRPYKRVLRAFDQDSLKAVCEMHETDFVEKYDMVKYIVDPDLKAPEGDDWFAYKDNGSNILAVAHLDTVIAHNRREAHYAQTVDGPVIFSGALDDRLGAYTILELLRAMGINVDVLLTVGEESGRSTAQYFEPDDGKEYNWMIEFDRGGTDVVTYQYEDKELKDLVKDSGARHAMGAFSDISYLEHLEIKGLNWGVGYRDYHGPRGHAFLTDYWMMIGLWVKFHEVNVDTYLPHEMRPSYSSRGRSSWGGSDYGAGLWAGDATSHGKHTYGNGHWWDENDDPTDIIAAIDRDPSILEDLEALANAEEDVDLDDLISEDFSVVNRELTASRGDVPIPPPY